MGTEALLCCYSWQDAKVSLTQGKRTKHASRQLRSALDTTLEQLTELESQAAQKQENMEAEVNNLALTW